MADVRTSATHTPQVGMLVAVLDVRYVLVRCDESGRWWGGRASRQRADGAWVPDTSTFLWCVPVPFRVVEDPPVQPGRRPGAMTLGVLEALRAAQLSMSVPDLLGRLGVHDRESLLTLQRRGDVVRVVRGRYRAVPRG